MKRAGDKLIPAMSDLLEKCGTVGKSIDGTLPESIIDLAKALGAVVLDVQDGGDVESLRAARRSELTQSADKWVAPATCGGGILAALASAPTVELMKSSTTRDDMAWV
jgi:hypothetical protein